MTSSRSHVSWSRTAGLLLVLLAAVGLVAACGDGSSTGAGRRRSTTTVGTGGSQGLAGTSWALEHPVEAGSLPTLDFGRDRTVSGSTGCNRFAGTFVQQGADLRITLGPLTQMACTSAEATRQEQQIVAALGQVRRVRQTADQLVLIDAEGTTLLTYSAVSDSLAGTSWNVLGVNTGGAVESSALTEKLTLVFGTDGSVGGNGGCNSFRGSYTQDGDSITIKDVASTMVGCQQDVADLETKYLAALQASTKATRSGDSLELRDSAGAMQVHAKLAG